MGTLGSAGRGKLPPPEGVRLVRRRGSVDAVCSGALLGVAAALIAIGGIGCGGASHGLRDDLAELRRQQTTERARLDAVRREIQIASAEADVARDDARFERCRARIAHLDARVEVARAECMSAVATSHECSARNSAHTAGATAIGCIVGIGATLLSAGAALPLGLAGCAAGATAGSATTETCASPTCAAQNYSRDDAARDDGGSAPPMCGGALGLVAETERRDDVGLPVRRVQAGTTAFSMSIAVGDVIVALNNTPTPTLAALQFTLAATQVGAPMEVAFVRAGRTLRVRAPAVGRDASGAAAARPLLGVELGDPTTVPSDAGARVAAVDAGGAAAAAGIRRGDVIMAVNDAPVTSDAQLREALRLARAGVPLTLVVRRADGTQSATVTPTTRGTSDSL